MDYEIVYNEQGKPVAIRFIPSIFWKEPHPAIKPKFKPRKKTK